MINEKNLNSTDITKLFDYYKENDLFSIINLLKEKRALNACSICPIDMERLVDNLKGLFVVNNLK